MSHWHDGLDKKSYWHDELTKNKKKPIDMMRKIKTKKSHFDVMH